MSALSACRTAIQKLEDAEEALFEFRESMNNKQSRHGEYYKRTDSYFESVGDISTGLRNILEWLEAGQLAAFAGEEE